MPTPDILRDIFLAAGGGIILRLVEYVLTRKTNSKQEQLNQRKDDRENEVLLRDRIDTLEEDLDECKIKYWEDVELIYQLKVANITIGAKLKEAVSLINKTDLSDINTIAKLNDLLVSQDEHPTVIVHDNINKYR